MISVSEAKKTLQDNLISGKTILLDMDKASGLVLSKDIFSPIDIPFFNNSAMDGYAICWQKDNNLRRLLSQSKSKAGDMQELVLGENEAIRIFTGAPVPSGADTIIPQEYVKIEEGQLIFDSEKFRKGANFRGKGAQNKAGDLIAKKGSSISPGMIGLLASVGISQVPVHAAPTVGIILTGDELEEAGNPLGFGKVYDANGPVMKSYLQNLGVKEIQIGKAIDEPEKLQEKINEYLDNYDILILSGGISVGDYDYVKEGLRQAGVQELFYKVKQKPGKPLFVGQKKNQWIFALPGNPASTLTCFNQYVKPCIEAWMGRTEVWNPTGSYPLANKFEKNGALTFFLKAKLENGEVTVLPGQESFNLISYGTANCIAEIGEEVDFLEAGTKVNIYEW
ncbi:molybdopterin molybdotransferase MoeA [Cognataquiflexum rubidum]|uniref:molybdopterin molybdotransferase MoeA n=1 Tax=Cognataquiflexum rubidum TaxID=2922273 RepID=UPI001F12D3B0|nr:molybdopterin molybdotransferase MoeA [Cognataquiflexum rubidum]MCH6232900.1 molybdopterin molybdotransferase MoeA [Cognataquiflexum rubidum]